MKKTMTAALIGLTLTASSAMACSPAPSCWMKEGPAYLRSVCKSSQNQTLAEMRRLLDEPELVPAFAKACKKIGVTMKVAS